MLSEKQILEVREHLERAQNPLFFYDNDADGLMSYVLLRRFLGRGKGIAIRTHPGIDIGYIRKIQELKADYVFVLDKPVLGKAFVEEVDKLGIPIVWIDHHNAEGENYPGIFVYDSAKDKGPAEPVTYLCYNISGRKEDAWIAMIGCIADHFMPDFVDDFIERHKSFWGSKKEIKEPFDAYYKTAIGLLARAIGFGLKDSITNVVKMQNLLISVKSPEELMSELDHHRNFGKKYREIKTKYDKLVDRAKKSDLGKLMFFSYSGDLSISSEVSNELCYLFPKKIVIVAYDNGGFANLSLRGDNVRKLIEGMLPKFEGATGGGHRNAVGARIKSQDLERFKETISELIK